jgi:hypothetical protein
MAGQKKSSERRKKKRQSMAMKANGIIMAAMAAWRKYQHQWRDVIIMASNEERNGVAWRK